MKKTIVVILISSMLLLAIISGCENSKEPAPITQETCDTKPKTYTNDVKAIMDTKCVVCHKPGGAYASLPLTNYSQVKTATDSGKVIGTIKHSVGFPAMPQGGAKLSDADLAIIDCWVSKGFLK